MQELNTLVQKADDLVISNNDDSFSDPKQDCIEEFQKVSRQFEQLSVEIKEKVAQVAEEKGIMFWGIRDIHKDVVQMVANQLKEQLDTVKQAKNIEIKKFMADVDGLVTSFSQGLEKQRKEIKNGLMQDLSSVENTRQQLKTIFEALNKHIGSIQKSSASIELAGQAISTQVKLLTDVNSNLQMHTKSFADFDAQTQRQNVATGAIVDKLIEKTQKTMEKIVQHTDQMAKSAADQNFSTQNELQTAFSAIKTQAEGLGESTQVIKKNLDLLGDTSSNIQGKVTHLSDSIKTVQDKITLLNQASSAVDTSAKSLESFAQAVQENVGLMGEAVNTKIKILDTSAGVVQKNANILDDASSDILLGTTSLGKSVETIKANTDLLSNASQKIRDNILALNKSVDAVDSLKKASSDIKATADTIKHYKPEGFLTKQDITKELQDVKLEVGKVLPAIKQDMRQLLTQNNQELAENFNMPNSSQSMSFDTSFISELNEGIQNSVGLIKQEFEQQLELLNAGSKSYRDILSTTWGVQKHDLDQKFAIFDQKQNQLRDEQQKVATQNNFYLQFLGEIAAARQDFTLLNENAKQNNTLISATITELNNVYNKVISYNIKQNDLEGKVIQFIENHVKRYVDQLTEIQLESYQQRLKFFDQNLNESLEKQKKITKETLDAANSLAVIRDSQSNANQMLAKTSDEVTKLEQDLIAVRRSLRASQNEYQATEAETKAIQVQGQMLESELYEKRRQYAAILNEMKVQEETARLKIGQVQSKYDQIAEQKSIVESQMQKWTGMVEAEKSTVKKLKDEIENLKAAKVNAQNQVDQLKQVVPDYQQRALEMQSKIEGLQKQTEKYLQEQQQASRQLQATKNELQNEQKLVLKQVELKKDIERLRQVKQLATKRTFKEIDKEEQKLEAKKKNLVQISSKLLQPSSFYGAQNESEYETEGTYDQSAQQISNKRPTTQQISNQGQMQTGQGQRQDQTLTGDKFEKLYKFCDKVDSKYTELVDKEEVMFGIGFFIGAAGLLLGYKLKKKIAEKFESD